MSRTISFVLVLAIVILSTTVALAASTFNGASQDSGTCGNFWANDQYKYSIDNYNSSTGTGVVHFQGSGVTIAGSSPNACNSGDNGNKVAAGISFDFKGELDFKLKPGTVPNASCVPSAGSYSHWFKECSGDPGYVIAPNYFWFYYKVCDGRWWQNASANRGGNQGDINGGLPEKTGACAPAAQWYNPNDGRVDPQPADRLVVWCNLPDSIVVYGVNNDSLGFYLTTFSNKEVLAAGKKGVFHNLGKMGVVSINEETPTYFWLAWNGGPFGAYGRDVWAKAFRCQFSAQ